jgi:8-oxo-dGTP diphosphatase
VDIRTVVVLFHDDQLLLLRRAPWKKLFPNRWTGLGGKVEPHELADPTAAALRELFEETDLRPEEVSSFRPRRALLMHKPDEGLLCLLYFTGQTASHRVPACNEGTLAWVAPPELASLDVIDNSAAVLPLLVGDARRGDGQIRCGVACYDRNGALREVVFPG